MKYTPFSDNSFNIQFIAFSISEILKYGIGFDCRNLVTYPNEIVNGISVKEANDNPYIVDDNNEKQFYQRQLVWELEDKQNLIDAIYNYTDIGKFVVIRNGYERIQKMIKLGHTTQLPSTFGKNVAQK